jgi:pyruvate kinase
MTDLRLDLSRIALKRRRTKIVATLGPASSTDEMVERLIVAGVNVFRLNFSHGNQELHGENIARIRRVADKLGHNVAILGDLCGPKIRVGTFAGGGLELQNGAKVTVTTRDVEGGPGLIPSQYPDLARDVRLGDRILLDDGKLELRVVETDGKSEVITEVVHGGWLSNKKGMNLPGVDVSAPALTEKDKKDAAFAANEGVDFLALSFVRTPADVRQLRALLEGIGHQSIPIIAKIEKPEAIQSIDLILDVVDGIMIARGDLGVEMPAEEVPLLQSELIRLAILKNRPVIVATQMLESMIESARPTRAEVTDVAAAAMARADAVMLSAETAAGKHPVTAVATMDRVLRLVEGYQYLHGEHGIVARAPMNGAHAHDPDEALSRATSLLSSDLGVRAIVVPTRSGRTARLVSAERPAAPVVALADDPRLCRRLSLSWGLIPELASKDALLDPRGAALEAVRHLALAEHGHSVLLVWDASRGGVRVEPTVSILHV